MAGGASVLASRAPNWVHGADHRSSRWSCCKRKEAGHYSGLLREQHLKSFWLIAAYSLHTVHYVQQRNEINTSPAGDMSPVVVTREINEKLLKNHLFLDTCLITEGGAAVPASRGASFTTAIWQLLTTAAQEFYLITARTAFQDVACCPRGRVT